MIQFVQNSLKRKTKKILIKIKRKYFTSRSVISRGFGASGLSSGSEGINSSFFISDSRKPFKLI